MADKEQTMKILSRAVQRWYHYYELEHDDHASDVLCNAAIALFNDGYRSEGDIATMLIGTYVGLDATKINAPTSMTLH
jgi:hypothetical protein